MTILVIALHHDTGPTEALRAACAGHDVEVIGHVVPGLSSAYHAYAASLRHDGRLLPALAKAIGAKQDLEAYAQRVIVSWSAPYAFVEDVLAVPADAAIVDAIVMLDSGYGEPSAGVVALAKRARDGGAVYFAGYTDVPTSGYLSSGQFLAKVQAEAGAPSGGFRVDHWSHDQAVERAAPDKGAFWRAEHIGALHRGPALLADALAALGAAPTAAPSSPVEPQAPALAPLTMGSAGEAVRELQRLLVAVGASPTVSIDGAFGPRTRAAVASAQTAFGLVVTGEADAAMVAALRGAVAIAPTDPTPGTNRLGARALAIAEQELAAGVQEQPLGSNRGARVDEYIYPTGLRAVPWCAAFESWCRRKALQAGETNPLGYNAAVSRLWAAAVQTGLARSPQFVPQPGDAVVFRRAGQDPRSGGDGHVGRVRTAPDAAGNFTTIEGNEADRVALRTHNVADPDICGFVEQP